MGPLAGGRARKDCGAGNGTRRFADHPGVFAVPDPHPPSATAPGRPPDASMVAFVR
jgi:hypothetical protein